MSVKKIAVSVLALLLLGCGGTKESKDNNVTVNEEYQDTFITDNHTSFTIFSIFNGMAFDEEYPVFKKASEMTNVSLKSIASKNQTSETQAFNLMLSSGNLPDIISYVYLQDLEKLGYDGGMIPLNDLIEEYAPNIKKFWEENPRYRKDAFAADGNIYAIPNYYDYFNMMPSTIYFIRQDWLDNLDLTLPTTVEELYEVLVAFRDEDPNKNGVKDEFPLFLAYPTIPRTIEALTDVFKARYKWYLTDSDEVRFGPAQEEYKVAIKNLAKWYKEGLIDPEVFTRGLSGREYMLSNDLGGFTNNWIGSTISYNSNPSIKENIPNFNLNPILPLSFNGNDETFQSRTTYGGAWGITAAAEDPISIIKYFDFWFTEKGKRLYNFGIEGEQWNMIDGKPTFNDYILNNPDGKNPLAVLREAGVNYRLGMTQDAEYERQWYSNSANEAVDLYMDAGVINPVLPRIKYQPEEMKSFVKIENQLFSAVEEMSQKWIMGASDVDEDWDNFIKRLNDIGLDEAQNIQQLSYDRFMQN